MDAMAQIQALFAQAQPFIRIHGIDLESPRWYRKPSDHRRGPWFTARYEVLDQAAWDRVYPCLYLVRGSDEGIRYVGISENRLKDRWRLSPAYNEAVTAKLPRKQLFHSQCWKKMEGELQSSPGLRYEVRVAFSDRLDKLSAQFFGATSEQSVVSERTLPAAFERWICQHKVVAATPGESMVPWNVALTKAG